MTLALILADELIYKGVSLSLRIEQVDMSVTMITRIIYSVLSNMSSA